MKRYFSLWSCSNLFGICVCRLFYCSEPWFYSHKLIAFILSLEKLDFFFLWFSFLHNFHGNINILIKVIKTIRLITLFFFIQCFHFLIVFPHYDCLVFTTCWNHITSIQRIFFWFFRVSTLFRFNLLSFWKSYSSYVGTVPIELLVNLLWDIARIFE
jgi:hypothetical protein